MSKRWDVITVGEIYIDHVLMGFASWPEPGSEVFAPSYKRELGGGAAITACGLGRLGRKVAVLGVVGVEEGEWIDSVLDANGADNSKLQWVGGHSGTTISISTSSDRAFLSYAGANILLPARLDDYAVAKWLTQAQHVHFAMALPRSVALRLLPLLRRAETTVSIDPGWQPAWYDDEANRATCREVDIFLPNEKEAAYIVGSTQQDKKPEEISAAVLRMGFANAVIKLGSKGAIATIGKSCRVCAPAVQVVDTTGAGDAFDAGVIDVFLEGATVEAMLRRGCLLGSLSTCAAGALQGLPRRQQIEEEYERVYKS